MERQGSVWSDANHCWSISRWAAARGFPHNDWRTPAAKSDHSMSIRFLTHMKYLLAGKRVEDQAHENGYLNTGIEVISSVHPNVAREHGMGKPQCENGVPKASSQTVLQSTPILPRKHAPRNTKVGRINRTFGRIVWARTSSHSAGAQIVPRNLSRWLQLPPASLLSSRATCYGMAFCRNGINPRATQAIVRQSRYDGRNIRELKSRT